VRLVVGERLDVNADRNILHQNAEQITPFYGEAMRYTRQALDTHTVQSAAVPRAQLFVRGPSHP
jgi:hypothetical protein